MIQVNDMETRKIHTSITSRCLLTHDGTYGIHTLLYWVLVILATLENIEKLTRRIGYSIEDCLIILVETFAIKGVTRAVIHLRMSKVIVESKVLCDY